MNDEDHKWLRCTKFYLFLFLLFAFFNHRSNSAVSSISSRLVGTHLFLFCLVHETKLTNKKKTKLDWDCSTSRFFIFVNVCVCVFYLDTLEIQVTASSASSACVGSPHPLHLPVILRSWSLREFSAPPQYWTCLGAPSSSHILNRSS